jgi:hypothetical protein
MVLMTEVERRSYVAATDGADLAWRGYAQTANA